MKFLNFFTAFNGLLQVILQAIKGLKIQKGIKKIDEEIAQKSDQKTKQNLEEIL